MRGALVGIFVGGRGHRMGGLAKGLLRADDGRTLVERTRAVSPAPCVLVGRAAAYARLGLDMLADTPGIPGPLGGLHALLEHAGDRWVIALACDMPAVRGDLLQRLLDAPPAPVVAVRIEGHWQPFFARYDAPVMRARLERALARGATAPRVLLDDAVSLPLDADELRTLRDWDSLEDVRAR